MAIASGGSVKAFFTNVDSGEVFYVQFNPKEFQLDEKSVWKDSGEHERYRPLITYEKGEPSKVSMELIFDTTDTGSNCYETYVRKLRDFLATTFEGTDADGKKVTRPPYVTFTWGGFVFDCVVESIGCTFLMFKPDGTPLRAKVVVDLKERERADASGLSTDYVTLSAMGSMFSGSAGSASSYTVQVGDTLSSVADSTGGDMRDIAAANGISDPMNLEPGSTLVIPSDSSLASVLAGQVLSDRPADYASASDFDPFGGDFASQAGDVDDLSSAFDEDDNDLGLTLNSTGGGRQKLEQVRDAVQSGAVPPEKAKNAVQQVVEQARS